MGAAVHTGATVGRDNTFITPKVPLSVQIVGAFRCRWAGAVG